MPWFTRKQTCVHCNQNKTKREFEGQPTCGDCEINILMDRESVFTCPIDNVQMEKEHHEGIIVDRCPECQGVWLDAGELKAIKEAVESDDSSFMTGLVIGIAT